MKEGARDYHALVTKFQTTDDYACLSDQIIFLLYVTTKKKAQTSVQWACDEYSKLITKILDALKNVHCTCTNLWRLDGLGTI